MINFDGSLEFYIHLSVVLMGFIGLVFFLKINWRRYGLLFLLAVFVGNFLCYIFVKLEFYNYPYLLFPKIEIMPFAAITFSFPIMVLLGVRYSPEPWSWKIAYYWTLIHLGVPLELWGVLNTRLIEYNFKWNFWDSYTWWWIYFLVFEWIGGIIVPRQYRKPLDIKYFRHGTLGWGIVHFIFIVTIFLAGYYLAWVKHAR